MQLFEYASKFNRAKKQFGVKKEKSPARGTGDFSEKKGGRRSYLFRYLINMAVLDKIVN